MGNSGQDQKAQRVGANDVNRRDDDEIALRFPAVAKAQLTGRTKNILLKPTVKGDHISTRTAMVGEDYRRHGMLPEATSHHWCRGGLGRGTALPISLMIKSALVCEGLRRILIDDGFSVQQDLAHPKGLDFTALKDEQILILDRSLLSAESHRGFKDLLTAKSDLRVVVLDRMFDLSVMTQSFEAGAHAYVLQDIHPASFVSIIRLVSLGEKVAPTEIINSIRCNSLERRNPSGLDSYQLTNREKEVLDRLALGMSNKLLSRDINLSEATVKLTLKGLFRKLKVRNRTQAAILAREAMARPPLSSRWD